MPLFCGRIKKIVGRKDDYLTLADGSIIAPTIIDEIFEDIPHLSQFRFIQKSMKNIKIEILHHKNLPFNTKNLIRDEMIKIFSDNVKIDIQIKEKLRKDKSGKIRFIISNIKHKPFIRNIK